MNESISQITSISVEFFNYAKEIYSYLEDDISKGIFKQRILYNITNDITLLQPYMSKLLKEKIAELEEGINNISNDEKIILWGAGLTGDIIYNRIKNKNNIIFCDKAFDKIITKHGIKVISPEEMLENYNGEKVIISNIATNEIYSILLDNNVNEENILIGIFNDEKEQYFDDIMKFTDDEVFLDIGAYNGETFVEFTKKVKNYRKIFAFEPVEDNIKLINDAISLNNIENIFLINFGAWDKRETLKFNADLSGSSMISEEGTTTIECDSVDNLIKNECVTFIKMDIEGAELNALIGAKNTISKCKPKLAISIYHKPEDIINLIMYIKSIVPEYKFYLRHYSTTMADTVLYAIIN